MTTRCQSNLSAYHRLHLIFIIEIDVFRSLGRKNCWSASEVKIVVQNCIKFLILDMKISMEILCAKNTYTNFRHAFFKQKITYTNFRHENQPIPSIKIWATKKILNILNAKISDIKLSHKIILEILSSKISNIKFEPRTSSYSRLPI
jgi:hypothetical protein